MNNANYVDNAESIQMHQVIKLFTWFLNKYGFNIGHIFWLDCEFQLSIYIGCYNNLHKKMLLD
jgi:hypothetical protein